MKLNIFHGYCSKLRAFLLRRLGIFEFIYPKTIRNINLSPCKILFKLFLPGCNEALIRFTRGGNLGEIYANAFGRVGGNFFDNLSRVSLVSRSIKMIYIEFMNKWNVAKISNLFGTEAFKDLGLFHICRAFVNISIMFSNFLW